MRPLQIDFRRPTGGRAPAAWALAGGAALALAAVLAGALLKPPPAPAAARPVALAKAKPAAALPAAERNAIAQARQRIALPWERVFATVEASLTPDVALLEVNPDPTRAELRIVAEARTLAAMLDYQGRLGTDPGLDKVTVAAHEVLADDPQQPVRFTINAQWLLQ